MKNSFAIIAKHGHTVPHIQMCITKYRMYGYNPIDDPLLNEDDDLTELTTREVEFLDAIISAFGCYSGPVLKKMTRSEKPWREARGSLLPGDRSVTEIEKDVIHDYFKQVVKHFDIVNPCDIVNYSKVKISRIS